MSTLLNDHPLVSTLLSTYHQAIIENDEYEQLAKQLKDNRLRKIEKRIAALEDEISEINTNIAEIFEYLERLDRRISKRGKS